MGSVRVPIWMLVTAGAVAYWLVRNYGQNQFTRGMGAVSSKLVK